MAPGMDQAFPVQGALNKFTLNLVVHTNGEIIFENHSETKNLNIIQGTWLPISATYAIGWLKWQRTLFVMVVVTEEPVTMTLKNAATWWVIDVLLNAHQYLKPIEIRIKNNGG